MSARVYHDGRMSSDEIVEEVRWFLGFEVHPEHIARELGKSVQAIEKILRAQGETALWEPFCAARDAGRKRVAA